MLFPTRRRRRRSGSQTIELIVGMPILFFAFVAVVQYGIQMLVQQAVTQAAVAAAREAGKGATLSEVVNAVNMVMAPHNIVVTNTSGSNALIILETSDAAAATTTTTYGDPSQSGSPPTLALIANEARVTLCVALTHNPMLNAFPSVGFDTTGRYFQISSLVKKE